MGSVSTYKLLRSADGRCHFAEVSVVAAEAAADSSELFGVDEDLGNYGQAEITPDEVFDMGVRADSDAAEAIVLSCTEMRSVEVISQLEDTLGKPVVTSNQAMMYEACCLLGLPPGELNFGNLFKAGVSQ